MAAQYLAMEDGTTVPNGPLIEHARHTANGAIALSFRNGTASRLKAMQPNYTKSASASAPNYKSVPKATPLSGISNIAAPTTTALQGLRSPIIPVNGRRSMPLSGAIRCCSPQPMVQH